MEPTSSSLQSPDTLVIKTPKKSPLVLMMVVLVLAMVCGVYVCSLCLRQISNSTKAKVLRFQVTDQACPSFGIEHWEIPYVHYPKPETHSREECVCNGVRYFAILSMQRSGSGWFETLLNSHINVSSNGEIFMVGTRRNNISSILRTMDQVYNLDWFSSASKNECLAAIGFKWMLNQLMAIMHFLSLGPVPIIQLVIYGRKKLGSGSSTLAIVTLGLMEHNKEIVEYFRNKGVSAIFLFRRNLLRRMISVLANSYDRDAKLLNGTHKSHVHSTEEAQILAKYKPTVNATLLLPDLEETEETITKALEYFKSTRHIVLYYEDLIHNHTKLKDVQEFLRLPYRELSSHQVKIHSGHLSKQVGNWDDVKKALKGTSYEGMLHADYQM